MEPVTAFILAVTGLITATSVLVGYFKTKARAIQTQDRVQEVHVLVNSKMSAALDTVATLEEKVTRLEKALALAQAQAQ